MPSLLDQVPVVKLVQSACGIMIATLWLTVFVYTVTGAGYSQVPLASGDQLVIHAHSMHSNRVAPAIPLIPYPFFSCANLPPRAEHGRLPDVRTKPMGLHSLHEYFTGAVNIPTEFRVQLLQPVFRELGCVARPSTLVALCQSIRHIREYKYRVYLSLNGVPAVYPFKHQWIDQDTPTGETHDKVWYEIGFPAASFAESYGNAYHVWNHLAFTLMYRKHYAITGSLESYEISGFEVQPTNSTFIDCSPVLTDSGEWLFNDTTPAPAHALRYSVEWVPTVNSWSYRRFQYQYDESSDWQLMISWGISITGSLLFVAAVCVLLLNRSIEREIQSIQDMVEGENPQVTERSWENIRGDVFRPPALSACYAAIVGAGFGFAACAFGTLLVSLIYPYVVTALLLSLPFGACIAAHSAYMVLRVLHRQRGPREGSPTECTIEITGLKSILVALYLSNAFVIVPAVVLMNIFAVYVDQDTAVFMGLAGLVAVLVLGAVVVAAIVCSTTAAHIIVKNRPESTQWMIPPLSHRQTELPRPIPPVRGFFEYSTTLAVCFSFATFAGGWTMFNVVFQLIWSTSAHNNRLVICVMLFVSGVAWVLLSQACSILYAILLLRFGRWDWHWKAPLVGPMSSALGLVYSMGYVLLAGGVSDLGSIVVLMCYALIACYAIAVVLFAFNSVACHMAITKMYRNLKVD